MEMNWMEEPNKACLIRFFWVCVCSIPPRHRSGSSKKLGPLICQIFFFFLWLTRTEAENIGAFVSYLEERAPSQGLKTKMCVVSHIGPHMESFHSRQDIVRGRYTWTFTWENFTLTLHNMQNLVRCELYISVKQ